MNDYIVLKKTKINTDWKRFLSSCIFSVSLERKDLFTLDKNLIRHAEYQTCKGQQRPLDFSDEEVLVQSLPWGDVGFALSSSDAAFVNLNEKCSTCPTQASTSCHPPSCPPQQGEGNMTT